MDPESEQTTDHNKPLVACPIISARIGPYPTSRGGVKHALVMIDCFSKHVKIYPVKNATRITATRKLFNDYIPHQGAVGKVMADHGSQFKAPKGDEP